MLPSTGYFKGINCPFYDNGLCERPYCHFRHVKKDPQSVNSDGIDSGEILQKLVSAAVQKVLRQSDSTALPSSSQSETDEIQNNSHLNPAKATYSPTPISELNKINNDLEVEDVIDKKRRHIPVPYTPRKPATLQIKRPVDTNGSKLYVAPILKYTPGSESAQIDTYTPKGTIESNEKYMPGTEAKIQEYLPNETQASNKHNYVPSDKYTSKNKIIEYKPTIVTKITEKPSVKYQPTPKSLVPCFSSDEDEPQSKKQKISNDLNGFDDLGPEFDILDQILDEESTQEDKKSKDKLSDCKENQEHTKDNVSKPKTKSNDKSKSVEKESRNKDKHEKKSKDSNHKSVHKSSRNDKDKDKKDDRSKSDKKSTSSHKSSDRHSKSSSSESKSKHSKSTSSKHKHEDKKISKDIVDDKKRSDKHHKSHKKSKESKDNHKKKKRHRSVSNSLSENDHSEGLENIEDENISESDEETIAEECKRIFEEYVPEPKQKTEQECSKQEIEVEEEYIPTKKRISRTVDKNIKVVPKTPIKPDFKVNAAQAMAERLAKVKQYHASKIEASKMSSATTIPKPESSLSSQYSTSSSSKIRIAHVPYASTLVTAKKSISSTNPPKAVSQPSTSFTSVQTIKKGAQRVAHVPNDKFIDRPGVLEPLGSKIPANIRSTYLNLMIDQCLKIYLSATDAYARAQHEELTSSKKCSTVPIYKNSAVLAISRLKKEIVECNGVKKSSADCATLQKMPNGSMEQSNSSGSWSIESRSKKTYDDREQYTGAKLYNNIKKWILTEEQLRNNGFPRPHSNGEKGRAIIYGQNKQNPPKGFIRTCCRCKKDYTVNKKGFPSVKEECIYHPNNKYRVRGEVKYQCCSQDGTSDGCCIAETHVYEYVDYDNLKGYVKTLPPEKEMEDYGVYSLDCEMCYTTQGLDLTRVTVINSSCKVIYETLIKPLHPIIDYNTRYSGITEDQMSNVKTTLLEVQATLLTMFNSKTILVGHSLESDFKALKLIHDTVIDTSVLFPHKMGPPFKRALRNLSSEYLKKIIQNSVDGHDSAEDATVCMELLCYKLKEDLKTR